MLLYKFNPVFQKPGPEGSRAGVGRLRGRKRKGSSEGDHAIFALSIYNRRAGLKYYEGHLHKRKDLVPGTVSV